MTDVVREWAVDKPTTDKLEAVLNDISDKGREVFHLWWTGGRDWVVVSYRDVDYTPPARTHEGA